MLKTTVEYIRLSETEYKAIVRNGNVILAVGHGRTKERALNEAVENQWREKVGLSIK